MSLQIRGVNDKIVAKIIQENNVSDGGIVLLQDTVQLPQLTCLIMSTGKDVTTEVKVGSLIYCHRNAGMDILIDKEPYKVLKDDEVYAIVNKDIKGE